MLVALRVGGMLLVAPMFSARTIPTAVRTALLLVLTLLLAPAAYRSAGAAAGAAAGTAGLEALAITPTSFLTETLIGFAIGLGAAVLVAAVETAGDLMTTTIGLSGASLLDPLNGGSSGLLAQFCQLFAVTVLLAVDGHLVMLDALAGSLHAVPVGTAVDLEAGFRALVGHGSTLFALGLRFAAPVIAASMIGQVALAVLTRAAPQLNVLTVAFPIQIAVGLAALVASLALMATWFIGWDGQLGGALDGLFAALLRRR